MAIIIGDIHGDLSMARAFLRYRPEEEHVSLGDLVDRRSASISFEEELACLDLLLESEATLVWGNHDLAYLDHAPWSIGYGYPTQYEAIQARYKPAYDRFTAAYAVGGWLCTHAGISTALSADLSAAGAPFDSGDATAIAAWLNAEFARQISIPKPMKYRQSQFYRTIYGAGPLFWVDWIRGGADQYGGMFWYDSIHEPDNPPDPRIKQIFAHTRVKAPTKNLTWINIHIDDGAGYWVYDTEVDDIVLLPAVA